MNYGSAAVTILLDFGVWTYSCRIEQTGSTPPKHQTYFVEQTHSMCQLLKSAQAASKTVPSLLGTHRLM